MEHIWTVVCRESIIDSQTNNISLISALERINFSPPDDQDVDGIPYALEVVSMWTRSNFDEPEQANGRLVLVSPGDEELANFGMNIDLTQHVRSRAIAKFMGLPFNGNGIYKFLVQIETDDERWQTVAAIPLEITRNAPETDN